MRHVKGWIITLLTILVFLSVLLLKSGTVQAPVSIDTPFVSETPRNEEMLNNDSVKIRETIKPTAMPSAPVESGIVQNVPFIVQAPKSNWKDPVYQNACEEAVILMAMRWVEGRALTKEEAFVELQKISDYSKEHYGFYLDQSAEDLAKLMRDYFKYSNVYFQENIQTSDIKAELFKGNLVLIPVNGQKLGNPYFTQPGPTEHMLLIKGYDTNTKEFITNDPGVGKGDGYRYKEVVIDKALRMYPSGYKEEVNEIVKAMIVVEK